MKENNEKYWYFKTIYYCPVCGGEEVYISRRYTEKPENPLERIEIIEVWDYCDNF